MTSEKHESYDSSNSATVLLSSNALAELDAINEKTSGGRKVKEREKRERVYSEKITIKDKAIKGGIEKEKAKKRRRSDGHHDRRRVSGPLAEEGRAHRKHRGGYVKADETRGKKRFGRKFWIILGILALVVIIAVAVGVVVSKRAPGEVIRVAGIPATTT